MKIGLLNPWRNSAESQLIPAIARAAERLGHTTVECKTSQEILAHQPDLVLSMSRTQPKLTSIPTYGIVFDPRDIILEQASYLYGLFSYDGVFTIFDTLHEFLSDLMFAAGRDTPIGYFYPTCSILERTEPVDYASARLAYFGINWDRRRQGLFALLADRSWMEVYGPEAGWQFLQGTAYKGTVPFDGISVLERYRVAGAGLCLFSDSHVTDDIVTSRVFEICGAGAVVISARLPWLERSFGDAVLYFDQQAPDEAIAQQIDQHMQWIHQHPDEAAALVERAQRIFRERFSLDVLLPGVLRYHEERQRELAQVESAEPVSVVVLCASGDLDLARRTIESIVRQDHRKVEIILAVAGEDRRAAYAELADGYRGQVERCTIEVGPAGGGSGLLWSALGACSGDLVAVVSSGDEWMPGHLASLLKTLSEAEGTGWAFSGAVVQYTHTFHTRGGNLDNRRLSPYPFAASRDDVVADALAIPIGSVLFRRQMLDSRPLSDPKMPARYETYLMLALLERETPAFSYRATMVHYQPDDPAYVVGDPAYVQAVTRLRLRFIGRPFPPASRKPDIEALQGAMEQRGETRRQLDDGLLRRRDGVVEYRVPASFEYLAGPEDSWQPVPVRLTEDGVLIAGPSADLAELRLPLTVEPAPEAWAYGLDWHLQLPEDGPYVLRLDCRVVGGTAGFGVLGWTREHFEYRVFASGQDDRVVVDLPISRPADVGGIVVQAGLGGRAVRVTLDAVQLFAATARFALAATKKVQEENRQLRLRLNTIRQHGRLLTEELKDSRQTVTALEEELRTSQRTVKAMRSSRIWKIATLYWRLASRLKTGPK